jgi:hypothetical protein
VFGRMKIGRTPVIACVNDDEKAVEQREDIAFAIEGRDGRWLKETVP